MNALCKISITVVALIALICICMPIAMIFAICRNLMLFWKVEKDGVTTESGTIKELTATPQGFQYLSLLYTMPQKADGRSNLNGMGLLCVGMEDFSFNVSHFTPQDLTCRHASA